MPPLLTVVLLIWVWNAIDNYVLQPVETGIRYSIVRQLKDIKDSPPVGAVATDKENGVEAGFTFERKTYVPGPAKQRYLPQTVVQYVDENIDSLGPFYPAPSSALAYWHLYVQMHYLPRYIVAPVFLFVFILAMYFLGRLFAFGFGHMIVSWMEALIQRLPFVSNIYGSVKQVTDFLFNDRQIEFNRVVAVEYPRKGIWSIGFVTGQSLSDIAAAANEPMLSVLMPTSPMPVTGSTVSVRRSEAIDLNITIDQAVQFIVSCGVAVPAHQLQKLARSRIQLNLPPSEAGIRDSGSNTTI